MANESNREVLLRSGRRGKFEERYIGSMFRIWLMIFAASLRFEVVYTDRYRSTPGDSRPAKFRA